MSQGVYVTRQQIKSILLWNILKIGTDVIFFIVLISTRLRVGYYVRYNVGRSQLQSIPAKSERVTIAI